MTESQINPSIPSVMHIDLNSCFATVMQQAYIHLRGKPLVISAYTTPRGFILSPSIEAKRLGIKMGMNNAEARMICPQVIVRAPDPEMTRDVHRKFRALFETYSPSVTPKSIDEAVIDFAHTKYEGTDLRIVGDEIRTRMRAEIGEWISCSIGIATNRFLAKLAAGIHKPNGLDMITAANIHDVYSRMVLTDFPGIATRYARRLNERGIYTPLEFLAAEEMYLRKKVFKSVVGRDWYLRMRGWEVDNVDWARRTYGHQYALPNKTSDIEVLGRLLMKLCEKMGRRTRRAHCVGCGIALAMSFTDRPGWHTSRLVGYQMYTIWDYYTEAYKLLQEGLSTGGTVSQLSVSCYELKEAGDVQEHLFDQRMSKRRHVSDALDRINDRYGEFVVSPASMMKMNSVILDRIAFGNVREL